MMKKYRAVISSNHVDKHGDVMMKESLEKMVETINSNVKARMGVDHRRDFPPKGRLENAELVEKDGYYLVIADFCPYEKMEIVSWDKTLIIESFDTPFQFIEVENEETNSSSISIDYTNFKSTEDAEKFSAFLKSQEELDLTIEHHGRKAEIPDPEIIFKFANTVLFYLLIKPTVKRIGEKIADEISEKAIIETKKLTNLIGKSLKEFFYICIPKTRPATIVFEFTGKPHIELIARTRDEKLVLKGLRDNQLKEIQHEIGKLSESIQIAKVQFLLSEKGKWKFNYLITEKGETIGKKVSFSKRDRKLEMISKKRKNGR